MAEAGAGAAGAGTLSDGVGAAARRAMRGAVKARARAYRLRPAAMEALHPGLSTAAPAAMVALSLHLVRREQASPRRWFGFGGEVGLVNARAALLLGRLERRRARRSATPRCSETPEPRSGAGVCRPSSPGGIGPT